MFRTIVVVAAVGVGACALAQEPATPADKPKGQVLFQSHGDAPEADSDRKVLAPAPVDVSDTERAAVAVTAYELDAHVAEARSALSMRARLTVQNVSTQPVSRVALQVSSTLEWAEAKAGGTSLTLQQHLVETDADHTGKVNEAVITLARPLAPGATAVLDLFYAGTVEQSGERLRRIGASAAQAAGADWDAVSAHGVALRGFGNVIWYPVAAAPVFLGDGAKLFETIARTKLHGQQVPVRLRLSVEYAGEAPVAAFFCGREQKLVAMSDNSAAPTADGGGIATAEWKSAPLGFRVPSLFVMAEKPEVVGEVVDVSGAEESVLPRLGAAVGEVSPMLTEWMGPRAVTPLTLLEQHGQPFEDGALLAGPVEMLASSDAKEALAHSLTHAWVATGQPWMDEGLAQFFALEWTERELGREAAVAKMQVLLSPLALGEPAFKFGEDVSKAAPGQPLVEASEEMFYRRKAAAVWWMLRDIVGDEALKGALTAWRTQPPVVGNGITQAEAFEKLLEGISGKDLGWFFEDWVLRDLGLPDLTMVDVTPRPLPAGKGHDSGWLVAVTVRNDGAAVAEVPLVVKSGTFSTTRRVRVGGFAQVTERVFTEGAPTEVTLNDGSVPEGRSSTHSRVLELHQK